MGGGYLGVELGSTRIKATLLDEACAPVSSGGSVWKSRFENGNWTYPLDEAWSGLRAALGALEGRETVRAMGVSGMMHGYLAFDRNWNLLTPFRTWQNTSTGPAARMLTEELGVNIPQRWSAAHLYQALLNGEEHVFRIAHLTTLAGYVHFKLTGVNAVGLGEASGMFPIDGAAMDYDAALLERFDALTEAYGLPWKLRELLPKPLPAGADAGALTAEGSALLGGLLPPGIPLAPPEGDAGTGMTATDSLLPRTGNVSAGTSIFAMAVLERPLRGIHGEIDLVATPEGLPAAMVHCNNCTQDLNAWAGLFSEAAALFGALPETGELFSRLYEKSLEGDADCGGVLLCGYVSGESVTGLDAGRPMVLRRPDARLTLANFLRASLYASIAALKLGMDVLTAEGVTLELLTAHGGLFKTPGVAQRYLAAACGVPVVCRASAGEGGPYGMALLAAYRAERAAGETLTEFLHRRAFSGETQRTELPRASDAAGFAVWLEQHCRLLELERHAAQLL